MKVWLSSIGEYSYYRVVGAFSSLEKLQEFQTKYPIGKNNYNLPEEFSVDFGLKIPDGVRLWEVVMYWSTGNANASESDECPPTQYSIPNPMEFVPLPISKYPDWFRMTVWAKSKEHAVKIVSEFRRRRLACGP